MARSERGRHGRLLPLLLAILALGGAVAGGLLAAPPQGSGKKSAKGSGVKQAAYEEEDDEATPAAKKPAPEPSLSSDWRPGGPAGGPAKMDSRLRSPQSLKALTVTAENEPYPMPPELQHLDLTKQTKEMAAAKSDGCLACHAGARDMHFKDTLHIGCTDCHGSDAQQKFPEHGSTRYCPAAPPSQNPGAWRSSANPVRSYTLLNHESPDFIRFVNPGDLRIAHISCGTTNCHTKETLQVRKCMMTNGCMLWGAALYNNGAVKDKNARYGEAYSMSGKPLRIQTVPPPSEWEMKHRAVLNFLDPLPRYENSQPANILRIFERGGAGRAELGIPNADEDPGRPFSAKLSTRGLGTENRTDPVFIGLQKTRLFDPTLNFIGTNDHSGDYRQSGCTACHVIYANDRSPVHSGPYAKFGNKGMASSEPFQGALPDPMIPKDERGHPIVHRFAKGNSIPTSQCMVCHIHPGTTVMNSYVGMMWWDLESDGDFMYPAEGKKLSTQEFIQIQLADPMELSARGNFSDPDFLDTLWEKNLELKHNQFADFHGHGWVFRAVYRHDRKGFLTDYYGEHLPDESIHRLKMGVDLPAELKELYKQEYWKDPAKKKLKQAELDKKRHGSAMHLLDIHMEKGMHCIDCHFVQDMHGNTRLQGEVRAAIEIQCIDCHGTVSKMATLKTSGPAAYTSTPGKPYEGRDLKAMRTPSGKPRFEIRGDKIFQNSMVEEDLTWPVKQVRDTINPNSSDYNQKSALAKTVRYEGKNLVWGDLPEATKKNANGTPIDDSGCAHSNSNMTCITCHSSWNPSCYGCHLPQKANMKMPQLHNEGDVTRNYTSYNWQTLRDDVFMLARDGNATGNRINPSRSSCAVHVTSYNNLREMIYTQQQTISSEGWSGIAFSTNVPHTVSGKGTTKMCTDCHLSTKDDNNAIMCQLMMQGTGFVNFIGRLCWVGAGEHGLFAPVVSERPEPQCVIGSTMHKNAYPEEYEKHEKHDRMLKETREHPGKDILDNITHPFRKVNITAVQARGEYLYAACGAGGIRLFDISMVEHKGFSEKIFTAPASPAGQKLYIPTQYCTSVAAPTTIAPDPTRQHYPENDEVNEAKGKPGVNGIYAHIYATDKYEGLIVVSAANILDGNPLNNFLKRTVTFNPKGILFGARAITIIGTYAYICCDAGVVVVSIATPDKPEVKAVIGPKYLKHPVCVSAQFRYAYIADKEDIKVFDITELANPKPVSKIAVPHVHNIYLGRTYAYCAAGKQGLVILDIEHPQMPRIDQVYNADGCINDCHDVKLGIYYNSQFAFLADGKNGMRVVQLTSPETPGTNGFSPRPTPELIATFKIPLGGHALTIGRGVDRDRAVDESGNQLAVFCRVGARPLNLAEQQKMYLRNGELWKVSDEIGEYKEGSAAKMKHVMDRTKMFVEPENGNGGSKMP
jgi:hypothetical protein